MNQEAWNYDVQGSKMYRVMGKIDRCRVALRETKSRYCTIHLKELRNLAQTDRRQKRGIGNNS